MAVDKYNTNNKEIKYTMSGKNTVSILAVTLTNLDNFS